MDIFDKIQTLPPEAAMFVASLFVVCFTLVFGAFLVHVAVKHGRVVERKEAREIRRKIKQHWWEEIK